MEMFLQIIDLDNLARAWRKVASRKGAAGLDGVRIGDYARDALKNLIRLQRRLQSGQYHPKQLREVHIPKKGGGLRHLAIPCVEDRIVQSAIAAILTPLLDKEMEDSSFAYRPGRSVQIAVDRVDMFHRAGFNWVVEADVLDYFDSIPHDLLLRRLTRSIDDAQVLDLITDWLKTSKTPGMGVAQGSPLSPLCANLFFDEIDERLHHKEAKLVRFADDFVILCRSKEKAEKTLHVANAILQEYGLELHPEKTGIVAFDQGFDFLGRLFVKSMILKQEEDEPESVLAHGPDLLSGNLGAETTGPDFEAGKEEFLTSPLRRGKVRTLYAVGKGRCVGRQNNGFRIYEKFGDEETEVLHLHESRVDRIEVYPGVGFEQEALELAFESQKPVAFMTGQGREIGAVQPPTGQRAAFHLKQAGYCLDPQRRQQLACLFVEARCLNQRALLKRLNRRRKLEEVDKKARLIGRLPKKLALTHTVEQAMGVEGQASALYWPMLGKMLREGWSFTKRQRHEESTRFDVVLNMLAWQLTRDMEVMIARTCLHGGFSFLHAAQDYRDSLAFDLIEEFRAPLCEGLAVYLVNNRILSPEMFLQNTNKSWRILPHGRDRVFREYKKWLERDIAIPDTDEHATWRGLMDHQVHRLIRHIEGRDVYVPYIMDY